MDNKNIFNIEVLNRFRRSHDLSDFVYDALFEAIISGKLEPGSKLKQVELAQQLDVSQNTVREALKSLANSGLVIQKPNRGFTVAEIPVEEQEEIYELRTILEVWAIDYAVDQISDEEIARMQELLPSTTSPDQSLSPKSVRESNREFHMIPIRATKKRHLIRILEQFWDLSLSHTLWPDDERLRVTALEDMEEHKKFLDALEKRDPEQARAALIEHNFTTKRTRSVVEKIIKKLGVNNEGWNIP